MTVTFLEYLLQLAASPFVSATNWLQCRSGRRFHESYNLAICHFIVFFAKSFCFTAALNARCDSNISGIPVDLLTRVVRRIFFNGTIVDVITSGCSSFIMAVSRLINCFRIMYKEYVFLKNDWFVTVKNRVSRSKCLMD